MVFSQWGQWTKQRNYPSPSFQSYWSFSPMFRRFSGNFTNVAVPANSSISWSIAFDNLTYISNGSSQSMTGMLASVDMYRTWHILFLVRYKPMGALFPDHLQTPESKLRRPPPRSSTPVFQAVKQFRALFGRFHVRPSSQLHLHSLVHPLRLTNVTRS